MTLLEIKQDLARETNNNASSLDAKTDARFQSAINRHYKRLASLPGLQHLRDGSIEFDSEAGVSRYSLENVAKITRIFDPANRRYLHPMSMQQYRALSPDADSEQGTPTFWIWEGGSGTTAPTFDLYLYQTPSEAITYTCDATMVLRSLVTDSDVPILPADFHDLLFLGALVDEYRHQDDSRASFVAAQMKEREAQFKYWMHETAAGSMPLSENGTAQPSRLGPWFPAGS